MNVEDYLEILGGYQTIEGVPTLSFPIERSDISLINSLSRQTFKGIPLTDKQLELAIKKITKYKTFLSKQNIDVLNLNSKNLRMPLRVIDRSKYIKIEDNKIKVRFPFNKKTILIIEELKRTLGTATYNHTKGSHVHSWTLNESNLFYIVDKFKEKQFDIDKDLLTAYEKCQFIMSRPYDYMPGIYNYEIRNVTEKTKEYIINNYGSPNVNNLYSFKDKSKSLGLYFFDNVDLQQSMTKISNLSQSIANRKSASVFVKKQNYTLNAVIESLYELDRFPLLVLLEKNETAGDDIIKCHQSLKGLIKPEEVSVLFRLDNDNSQGEQFNIFVKESNLNNPVDKNTKVVYISKSKVPKPLLQSKWQPSSLLLLNSTRLTNTIQSYVNNFDLVVHYDEVPTTFFRHIETI